jgi:TRAP-type mannitol/chloroaromatic compound transport system permease small subunit
MKLSKTTTIRNVLTSKSKTFVKVKYIYKTIKRNKTSLIVKIMHLIFYLRPIKASFEGYHSDNQKA